MADDGAKRLPIDILHHQKGQSLFGLAGVEKGHDARVIDTRQRFHFGVKLFPGPLRGPRQRLDHHAFGEQLAVFGEIDRAETTAAQLLNDSIPAFQHGAGAKGAVLTAGCRAVRGLRVIVRVDRRHVTPARELV
jgi:hypothetical protein